jgi:arylsulfatase A-like enzyme
MPVIGNELNKRGYATYAMGKLHYDPYSPPGQPPNTQGIQTVEFHESGRMLAQFDPAHTQRGIEAYHDYLKDMGWGGYSRGNGMGNNDVYPAVSPIPATHYTDAWVADRAIFHMDKHLSEKPEQPFFMWASFPKPHSAFDPPRPYDQMYDPRSLPPPEGTIEDLVERGHYGWYDEWWTRYWDLLSPACKQVIKAHYYGLISFQDTCVSRLLDFLKEKDIDRDTVIVYTADHGEMLGDFGIYFKAIMYNGSVRVPFMLSWPGVIPKNTQSEALAGLQDVLPTLLSIIGEPLEVPVDGQDLSNLLAGKSGGRDVYISQTAEHPEQEYMAVNATFKYIYREMGGYEELYDQKNDRHELINLAGDPAYAQEKEKLKEALLSWCQENDPGMLKDGGFVASPQGYDLSKKERHNKYGRRHY